ncbi:MAG: hypothetical protein EP339_13260 [Gammaproteobacteria bacterium]|nr:MAG: hypothetical protein EP339_13260 [Gammaproteobacteria bacterium]
MRRINIASTPGRVFTAVIALSCLAGCYFLMNAGLQQLTEARQMERLPQTPIAALTQGPYAVAGTVNGRLGTTKTPYSATEAVYYRYKLEEEYRDSDGDRRVRTLDSGQSGSSFVLDDQSGNTTITPGFDLSTAEWNIHRTYRRKSGSKIYSEWALRPGDTVRVIGNYSAVDQSINLQEMPQFNLPTLVSTSAQGGDSGDRLFGAALRISIATGLLALGLALLLPLIRIHRFWVYVVIMSLAVGGTLSTLGITKLRHEWQAIAALYETRYQQLDSAKQQTLALADVAALKQLIRLSTSGWLDRWMFRNEVENRLPLPELNAETTARAQAIVENQLDARYQHTWTSRALAAGSVVLALICLIFAIRTVKLKRLIEAVPTSSTRGLSFGLSELKGMVDTDDQYPPLRDPLNDQKCVAFDYKVEEKRGSGKDEKWKVVEHRTEQVPFWLEDNEGQVLVAPDGASIDYPLHHSEIRGDRRYSVRLLDTLVNVYCLGFAGLDRQQSDRLTIQQDENSPFLISGKDEEDIVLDRGARGFAGIAVSLGLTLFSATSLFAADGGFSPDNLILSALMVPLLLSIYTGILHYNDIVFLKNRVDRARANIDTILQQRHDLWPNLESVVKVALSHEKKLHKVIAHLRQTPPSSGRTAAELEKTMGLERQVARFLQARVENYPDLRTNEVIQTFMAMMADTENYLSLLRDSYTESAMIYNTRIQSFPDLILAALFRFKAVSQFSQEGQ